MKIAGQHYRTIWVEDDGDAICVLDQTRFPHEFATRRLRSWQEAATAISEMVVRGAPLIGVTACYGIALAMREDPSDANLHAVARSLTDTRPTAINLRWAVNRLVARLERCTPAERAAAAFRESAALSDEDVATNEAIGREGLALISCIAAAKAPEQPVNVLTHCNAGWLATVDWGTATAPIYMAHDQGLPVHVFVDETRPRNQGAYLTAWELGRHGVPHTVVVDNAGGHLMQHGEVDLVIVGSDRTTANGDVCNKIGTYLKALAAHDNGVPFYVALPTSTVDFEVADGVREIPIEERSGAEIRYLNGRTASGDVVRVDILPEGSGARNPAFDVTPARLVTGLITELGVFEASPAGMARLRGAMAGAASGLAAAG